MTQAASMTIASQLMPLNNERLVLPNTAIAEIISFNPSEILPSPVKKAPDWLLGMIVWRGLSVPVIAFEKMLGGSYETQAAGGRLAVLNAAGGLPRMPFIAMPTQSIPQLIQIDDVAISVVVDTGETNPAVACHVVVAGKTAIIPNLDEVERQLAEVFAGPTGKKKAKKK